MPWIRTAQGLLIHDTFDRANGNLNGDNGWVVSTTDSLDQGNWQILSSNYAVNLSAANNDRIHWGGTTARDVTLSVVAREGSGSEYIGLRWGLQPSPTLWTDYTLQVHTGRFDFGYRAAGASVGIITNGNPGTLIAGDWYRVRVRFRVDPTLGRLTSVWLVHGTITSGVFTPDGSETALVGPDYAHANGPNTVGYVGMEAYGGMMTFDQFTAARDGPLLVHGLTGSQGVRLYNPTGTVLLSSAAQSGGTATLDLTSLDGVAAGYLQVFDDAGTWAAPHGDGRIPSAGTLSDIAAADVYDPITGTDTWPQPIIQVNWSETTSFPAMWSQTGGEFRGDVIVGDLTVRREAMAPEVGNDTASFTIDDPAGVYFPGHTTSPLYPAVDIPRFCRILMQFNGQIYPWFFGQIMEIQPSIDFPYPRPRFIVESPMRRLMGLSIGDITLSPAYPYDPQNPGVSVLTEVFNRAASVGYAIANNQRVFDTDLTIVHNDAETISAYPDGSVHSGTYTLKSVTVGAAIRDLCTRSGGMLWLEPLYRTTADGVDWRLRWTSRATLLNTPSSLVWSYLNGDLGQPTMRYTRVLATSSAAGSAT